MIAQKVDEKGGRVVVVEERAFNQLENKIRDIMHLFGAIELAAKGANVAPGSPEIEVVSVIGNNKAFELLFDLGFEKE